MLLNKEFESEKDKYLFFARSMEFHLISIDYF